MYIIHLHDPNSRVCSRESRRKRRERERSEMDGLKASEEGAKSMIETILTKDLILYLYTTLEFDRVRRRKTEREKERERERGEEEVSMRLDFLRRAKVRGTPDRILTAALACLFPLWYLFYTPFVLISRLSLKCALLSPCGSCATRLQADDALGASNLARF